LIRKAMTSGPTLF